MPVRELKRQGEEDRSKAVPGFEIPKTGKARTEVPIRKVHPRNRLGYGRPSGSGEPWHGPILFIIQQIFNLRA